MLNSIYDMMDFFTQDDNFTVAVGYTAGRFGFSASLIEKDFLCSLILKYLYSINDISLVFKGGTLLSKVYANFNRMSEDLDFVIPMPHNAQRNQRSSAIKPIKEILNNIQTTLPIFTVKQPLIGHNNSCQYTMALNYISNLTNFNEQILIDIGMRDELLIPIEKSKAQTILMDQFLDQRKVEAFEVTALHLQEAYAEKTRAALCRRELAIRDYYDLDYASVNDIIDFENDAFLSLVKKKVQHETNFHDFNDPTAIKYLQSKISSELEPTLRKDGIATFNLYRILSRLALLSSDIRLNHAETVRF